MLPHPSAFYFFFPFELRCFQLPSTRLNVLTPRKLWKYNPIFLRLSQSCRAYVPSARFSERGVYFPTIREIKVTCKNSREGKENGAEADARERRAISAIYIPQDSRWRECEGKRAKEISR